MQNSKVRSLRNCSKDTYENILREVDWYLVYTYTGVNDAWSTFKTTITEVMNKVVPEKEMRIKNRIDPWINNEIVHQIEFLDKLVRRLTRHKDDTELWQEYNNSRNKLVRNIKSALADCFCNMTEERKHEPSKL